MDARRGPRHGRRAAPSPFDIIREISRQGVAILLVEQNAHQALAHAGRGYLLETGRISARGTSEELQSDRRIQEAYLGGSGLNAR